MQGFTENNKDVQNDSHLEDDLSLAKTELDRVQAACDKIPGRLGLYMRIAVSILSIILGIISAILVLL